MSGERDGVRQTMDRMVRESVQAGASREWAAQKAREAAERWDRKQDGLPARKPERDRR